MFFILYTITALFTPPILFFDKYSEVQLATPSPEPFESEAETISFLFGSSNIFFDEAKIQLVTPSPEPLEISPINPNSRQWRLESLLTDALGWIERQGIECAVRRVTRTIFQF